MDTSTPVVRVDNGALPSGFVLINESDFDPAHNVLHDSDKSDAAERVRSRAENVELERMMADDAAAKAAAKSGKGAKTDPTP